LEVQRSPPPEVVLKTTKLAKGELERFITLLGAFGEVHAPVARDGGFAFQKLTDWREARLDYTRTILPPKKYVLPPKEELFHFDADAGYVAPADPPGRMVLFGVHPCDVYGLNILDEVFEGRYPDPYFRARRKAIAVVGVDCVPDEHCFCRSMRADFVDHGFDLFLYDIGADYLVLVGTALGDDMVLAGKEIFRAVTPADIDEYKRRSTAKEQAFQLQVEIRDLPEIFELEYDSGFWQELGDRCLSCGSCTVVCPTCYCYEARDEVTLGSCAGARERCWDSCVFHTHALVAGGENFREQRADRIKFRFYHKQRGFVAEYGRPSCVGCGRCIPACPVGINIVEVVDRLRGARDAARC
jgi:sulfhydrogenase subunit beta (sulfur reductase)